MLLQRRELKADRMTDNLVHVNVFTDASPTTGEELQGQVVELTDRALQARWEILPGATLPYGNYSAISKGVVLVYGLWLIGEPFFATCIGCFQKSKGCAQIVAQNFTPSRCQTCCALSAPGKTAER